MTGRVYIIGAGPGDPGLFTMRGLQRLQASDMILYDHLVSAEILGFARADAERLYVGKIPGHHTHLQEEINQLLVEKAKEGYTVARLKGGDPFVFGRGAEEAELLAEHGISFEIVPGVTSAIAGPAYAGIPLTHRDYASGFHVVTGHECATSTTVPWSLLASSNQTLVILMGIRHLREITRRLINHGRSADTPAAIIGLGTTTDQTLALGTLGNISEVADSEGICPPATIVIGDVVRLSQKLDWFKSSRVRLTTR